MTRDCALGIASLVAALAVLFSEGSGMVATLIALGVVFTAKDMRKNERTRLIWRT